MSIYSSVRRSHHPRSHSSNPYTAFSGSAEDSIVFSNLQEAGSYLQSSAAKLKEYLAIHEENNSKYLSYSESNFDCEKSQRYENNSQQQQKKLEMKVPIMRSLNKEQQLKDRIGRLGLQNLMRELISTPRTEKLGTKEAIEALNKTYINQQFDYKHQGIVPTFGRKSSRGIKKKVPAVSVNWDPETIERDLEFKEVSSFIPNQMFPCRNNQTRILKSKQKNKKNYVSSQPFYGISPTKMMERTDPSIHSSVKTLKTERKMPNSAKPSLLNFQRKSSELQRFTSPLDKRQRRVWSARSSVKIKSDKIFAQNIKPTKDPNGLIKATKAKIYH